jgi:hypothetical protein
MERNPHSWLTPPTVGALPGADATLQQIIRFAQSADPTAEFRARWGENYQTNVKALWDRCVQSYNAGVKPQGSADELLMCLAYDIVLGPYLGVPEPHKRPFLLWLIDGVRQGLQSSDGGNQST